MYAMHINQYFIPTMINSMTVNTESSDQNMR